MIQNEDPVIANSLWSATANATPDCPPLQNAVTADVCVIGAGFTGLSAALHLAQAGQSVVVLEAQTPGWGASGRNGGQVNPGLQDDPDQIEKVFGTEMGARMNKLSGDAGQMVFDLIDQHNIQCDAKQVGWLRAAHTPKALRALKDRADQWRKRGADFKTFDAETTADMIGTTQYVGSIMDTRGGNIHPLNYALGLADAAIKAGAKIHGHTRALELTTDNNLHTIRTEQGQVTASKILLCTNGYTDGLLPPLAQTVVPVRSVQVATQPLSDNLQKSILPQGQAPSDTQRLLLYFRKDAAGRLIMGGRGDYSPRGTQNAQEDLRQTTLKLFPQLGDVKWSYAWGGYIAITADHTPHLHQMGDGIMAGLGYNGRGVAMATAMGRVLADWATGTSPADLPFPVTSPKPMPFHRFARLGVQATVLREKLLDRLGV